jgi:hypothetical protein
MLAGCQEAKVEKLPPPNIPESHYQITEASTEQEESSDLPPPQKIDEFFPVWAGDRDNNRIVIHNEYGDPDEVYDGVASRYQMIYNDIPRKYYITRFYFARRGFQPTPAREDYVRGIRIEFSQMNWNMAHMDNSYNLPQGAQAKMLASIATADELLSDDILSRKPDICAGEVGHQDWNRTMLVPIWEIGDNHYLIVQLFIPHYSMWIEETKYNVETGKQTPVRKINLSDDDGIYRFGGCQVYRYYQLEKDDFWTQGGKNNLTEFFFWK